MAERSDELVKASVEGKRKYDYFVATISTALFAYIGKDFTPALFGINQSSLVLLALLTFVISILATLKKIELQNVSLEKNAKLIDLQDKKDVFAKSIEEGKQVIDDGKLLGIPEMRLTILAIDEVLSTQTNTLGRKYERITLYTHIRDWSLFIGLTFLAFSKLLPALCF